MGRKGSAFEETQAPSWLDHRVALWGLLLLVAPEVWQRHGPVDRFGCPRAGDEHAPAPIATPRGGVVDTGAGDVEDVIQEVGLTAELIHLWIRMASVELGNVLVVAHDRARAGRACRGARYYYVSCAPGGKADPRPLTPDPRPPTPDPRPPTPRANHD